MAYVPNSGSIVSFQSDPTKLQVTASVAGIIGASVIGLPTIQTGNNSVIALIQGSVATVGVAVANQSVSGTVVTTQIAGSVMAVSGSFTAAANQSVSGTVGATQQGTWSTSVMTNVITSIATAGQVMGSVATLQGTNPWIVNFQNSSIIAINAGSVVAITQGSVITLNQGSSILAVPVGSVITILQAPSIVGTYAEDAAHTSADKGLFTLMVRNDTVSSITSNDTDYSPHVVDAVGRTIIKPFAGEEATIISYAGSIVSGSVQLIQASAVGKKSYVTDFWLSNTGTTNTLVTFQDGSTSIIGQFIAPTGGGMSSPGIAIPLKTANAQDLAFKISPSSSILYLTLKGYQAQ